uniref:Uncharacterized protein n=1 Tax=Leersia perrieri TaxID=77586 RepID=A0A0D9W9S1_9ORYZ
MDITAPSFSLGSEFDEPDPHGGSDRYEAPEAGAYTAPDAPSFSLGIDYECDGDGGGGGNREDEQRRYEAPDAPSFSLGIDYDGDEPHLPERARREEQRRHYEAPDAPSFSLGIDSDDDGGDEHHLTDGIHREEEQHWRYEAPDAPSFSLGIDYGDDEPRLPNGGHLEEQAKHYEAPDAPSFSLGLDDEDDDLVIGGSHRKQARPQVTPLARTSLGIVEDDDDDDFVLAGAQQQQRRHEALVPDPVPPPSETSRFKRLRRGPAPPSQAPKPAPVATDESPVVTSKATLGDVGSWEDEIENFTDEERSRNDMPPSGGSCITSSNSKFSLMTRGVIMCPSTSKSKVFTHKPNYPASKSLEESCSKKLLPRIKLSPMRKIHLLDSDTDSDDNKGKPNLQQKDKSQANAAACNSETGMTDSWATPALDEFCNEYFKSVKDPKPSQRKEGSGFCGPKVMHSNYSVSENGGHFPHQSTPNGATLENDSTNSQPPAAHYYFHHDPLVRESVHQRLKHFVPLGVDSNRGDDQSTPNGAILENGLTNSHPPAVHYYFHHDPLVRELVHQRLKHFVPLGVDSNRGDDQDGTGNLRYRSQLDRSAADNDRWVTPNRRTSVSTEVGKRRVNTSGMSGSGHWFTGEDGKKVYVCKNGEELTGRAAYRQYTKESGKGFRQSNKKMSAVTKGSSSRGKKATPKVKQEKGTRKRKR